MKPAVQGYTAAVLGALAAEERPQLAADVAAVDRLLGESAELREAMTDVTVPPKARRAVLEEVLSGKVGAAASRVCGYAAGAVRAPEVPGAIAWIATRLRQLAEAEGEAEASAQGQAQETQRGAQRESGAEEVLGHQGARDRVGGYAAAVFEDVSVSELEEIEDELFRFARTVGATPELRSALGDRDVAEEARRGVVDELLTGKVHEATLRLVEYAVSGGRPRDFVGTLDWLVEQTAIARGWRVARVRAGQDVDADERAKLEETLSHLAGTPVELQVTVDPVLLAGVNVEIGDLRLDATARGRLERLREHVMAGEWTDLGYGRTGREAGREAERGAGREAGHADGSTGGVARHDEGPRS